MNSGFEVQAVWSFWNRASCFFEEKVTEQLWLSFTATGKTLKGCEEGQWTNVVRSLCGNGAFHAQTALLFRISFCSRNL
jgi:hypothetical protein